MKPHIVRIVLPVLAAGMLQAQVAAPRVGVIRCTDGSVRAVYGLAANFVLASKPFASADAASFSDHAGLIANNGTIQMVGPSGALESEYESHEAKPLLNVDGESTSAIAWLPSRNAILRWTSTGFRLYPVSAGAVDGRVTSIKASGPDQAELLVLNPDGSSSRAAITLSTGNLASLDALPGASGPAFAQQTALISHNEQGLIVETANGLRHELPVSGDVTIERMSSEWLHLSSASTNQSWALHVAGSQIQLFVLPSAQSDEAAK